MRVPTQSYGPSTPITRIILRKAGAWPTRFLYQDGSSWVEYPDGRSLSMEMIGPRMETEAPALVSATVGAAGNAVALVFDEDVDLPSDNADARTFLASLASAFAVTADGSGVAVSGLTASSADQLTLVLSGVILQGQAVTLTYTDPTTGDDDVALQDILGNETPTFTTGRDSVPDVINNSAITITAAGDLSLNFGTHFSHIVQVIESTANHRFLLLLNKPAPRSLTIPLEVTHTGGATEDDYEGLPSSVTFTAGATRASFSMRAIPDGKREPGEGLRLDFGPLPSGVARGTWGPYETIEFVDQVLPKYTVLFGAEEYTATEGGGGARVSIHLNEPVEIEPAEVGLLREYRGGASAADHSSIPESVTIPVGKQTATITVTATDDTADDDGESVTLSFVNDPTGRVRVRSGPSSATVALEDNDGVEQVTVSFGAATYTATEGGDDATVRVELDAEPGRAVTIPLTKADAGATPADYSGIPGSVAFAANQMVTTFTVTATADHIGDGGESVSIWFGTLPDGVFAGRPAAATVTLADGAEQKLVVNFGTSWSHTVQVREGGRRKRLRVLLDTNTRRPLTIPLVVTHVGGATEADYAELPESVTIAAGQSEAAYYVRALPDEEEDETGEGLRLDFGELPAGVRKGRWGPYETIAFVDAGPAANLSVSGATLTVGYPSVLDETSTPSPRDFVVLTAVPGGEVVIPVTAVAVDSDVVSLTLARPVRPDDTVTLSYLADAMHPTRDAAGLPAAPLTDEPVRNVTGTSGPLAEAWRVRPDPRSRRRWRVGRPRRQASRGRGGASTCRRGT